MMASFDPVAHHDALLENGRCGCCAEEVNKTALLRGGGCALCGATLQPRAHSDFLGRIQKLSLTPRLIAYGVVAVGSFCAGFVPLAQSIFFALALIFAEIVVLRRWLLWLPMRRRIAARICIRLFGGLLAWASLVANVATAPFPFVGAVVLAVLGAGFAVAYVEGGTKIVMTRLKWESEGRPFGVSEWGIPAAFLGGLMIMAALAVIVPVAVVNTLATTDVPLASTLAKALVSP